MSLRPKPKTPPQKPFHNSRARFLGTENERGTISDSPPSNTEPMKTLVASASIPFLLMVTVCGLAAAKPERASKPSPTKFPLTFTENSNGRTVKVVVGQPFKIRLESNPSIGYGWSIHKHNLSVLKSAGEPRFVKPSQPLPGAPGLQEFEFVANKAGTSRLELVYSRPWEKNTPPAQKFVLHLKIS